MARSLKRTWYNRGMPKLTPSQLAARLARSGRVLRVCALPDCDVQFEGPAKATKRGIYCSKAHANRAYYLANREKLNAEATARQREQRRQRKRQQGPTTEEPTP